MVFKSVESAATQYAAVGLTVVATAAWAMITGRRPRARARELQRRATELRQFIESHRAARVAAAVLRDAEQEHARVLRRLESTISTGQEHPAPIGGLRTSEASRGQLPSVLNVLFYFYAIFGFLVVVSSIVRDEFATATLNLAVGAALLAWLNRHLAFKLWRLRAMPVSSPAPIRAAAVRAVLLYRPSAPQSARYHVLFFSALFVVGSFVAGAAIALVGGDMPPTVDVLRGLLTISLTIALYLLLALGARAVARRLDLVGPHLRPQVVRTGRLHVAATGFALTATASSVVTWVGWQESSLYLVGVGIIVTVCAGATGVAAWWIAKRRVQAFLGGDSVSFQSIAVSRLLCSRPLSGWDLVGRVVLVGDLGVAAFAVYEAIWRSGDALAGFQVLAMASFFVYGAVIGRTCALTARSLRERQP